MNATTAASLDRWQPLCSLYNNLIPFSFSTPIFQDKKVIQTDSSRIEINEVVKGRQSIHITRTGKTLLNGLCCVLELIYLYCILIPSLLKVQRKKFYFLTSK
jgi:hypothetical protein